MLFALFRRDTYTMIPNSYAAVVSAVAHTAAASARAQPLCACTILSGDGELCAAFR
jgi:hypothetical protein